MIDQKQIPPEAGSAAENEVAQMLYGNPFSELSGAKQDVCTNIARAAIAAALAAWPGMKEEWRDGFKFDPLPHGTAFRYSVLILPLPQEARDD